MAHPLRPATHFYFWLLTDEKRASAKIRDPSRISRSWAAQTRLGKSRVSPANSGESLTEIFPKYANAMMLGEPRRDLTAPGPDAATIGSRTFVRGDRRRQCRLTRQTDGSAGLGRTERPAGMWDIVNDLFRSCGAAAWPEH